MPLGLKSAVERAKSLDELDGILVAVTNLESHCIASDDPRLKGK